MENTSQIASGRDSGHVIDLKTQRIAELEKLVERLRNALVSLEENNLNLNRKLKEQHALSCPDLGLMATSVSRTLPSQDGRSWLEVEKLEMEANLRRVESKSRELEAEVIRLRSEYGDVTAVNKSLERRNRQLVKENKSPIERTKLCRNCRRSVEAEEPDLEKQKLVEQVVQLQSEVTHLTEELQKVQPSITEDVESQEVIGGAGREPDTAALLRREDMALKENQKQSQQELKISEGGAEDGADCTREELERCLVTLHMEKVLLREEVRRLHWEYMSLTDSMASKLKATTHVQGTLVPEPATEQKESGEKELLVARRSGHSPPQRTTVDKPLGEGMAKQTREHFRRGGPVGLTGQYEHSQPV
ncbi:uncharacterized protein LOC143521473 isoform X1 [Brachyhypopomus gauderio]|uniref:uncharacterized protein LOC143521473 isoform X1 n=1 Tax=Brachyhypopomus gauderio TaxID=698409 RepID=UPI00404167EA